MDLRMKKYSKKPFNVALDLSTRSARFHPDRIPPVAVKCEPLIVKPEPISEVCSIPTPPYPIYADHVPVAPQDAALQFFAGATPMTLLPAYAANPYLGYGLPPYHTFADKLAALASPPNTSVSASFCSSPAPSFASCSPKGSATSDARCSPERQYAHASEYVDYAAAASGLQEPTSTPAKKRKAVSDAEKNEEYRRKRQRNNEAAKRSRDHKRSREQAMHEELEQARISLRFLKMVVELGTHKLPVCIKDDVGPLDHTPLQFTDRLQTLMRALNDLSETCCLREASSYDVRALCKGPL